MYAPFVNVFMVLRKDSTCLYGLHVSDTYLGKSHLSFVLIEGFSEMKILIQAVQTVLQQAALF